VREGKFVGLPIDEINESEKTDERIANWIETLRQYFPK
jgi:flavodoxin I